MTKALQNNFQNTLTTPDLSARDSTCITLGQNVTFESKLEKVSLLSGIVKRSSHDVWSCDQNKQCFPFFSALTGNICLQDYLPVKQRNTESVKEGLLQSEILKKDSIHLVVRIKKYTLTVIYDIDRITRLSD